MAKNRGHTLNKKAVFSFYAFNLRAGIRHHIIVFASAVNRIDEAGLSKRYFFFRVLEINLSHLSSQKDLLCEMPQVNFVVVNTPYYFSPVLFM